ncbi:MAG: BACON domain-containing protein [Bacteroidales bacterium]|nr:BACON domain-containing protein [Bacteroidales bacterium]
MKQYFIILISALALSSCLREDGFRSEGPPHFSIVVQDGGELPVAELAPMSAQYTLNLGSDAYSSADNAPKHITKAHRFHVTSNLRWKILPADGRMPDWIRPFPAKGEKDGIFFFKTARNIDPNESREALFNILVDDGSGAWTPLDGMLSVCQDKSGHFLEMSAARFNATAAAQTLRLRVLANVDWTYSLSPMSEYATDNVDWITDLTVHPADQQIDTLVFKLPENSGGIRGANISVQYQIDGVSLTDVVPLVQYPATEVQLDGFPVNWHVRVSGNTFAATFPANGTIPPVSGAGMITFHNEAGKAADTQGNVKLDVSDNSPRATGVWPGDYCEFVASSPVSSGTVVKLTFATRSSAGGMKYWRLEFRDGEVWRPVGKTYTDASVPGPDGNPVVYTHTMNPNNVNTLVEAVAIYTEHTDQVEFRFICAANSRVSGGPAAAPNTGTWRLSVDTANISDAYQPSISIVAAGSEPPAPAMLSVSPLFLSFEPSSSGTKTIRVTSDQTFTVTAEQSWIHVNPTTEYAGENVSISVTCDDNALQQIREGYVTIVAGITRKQVAIIQAGSGGGGG